jgi:hypothetical protein
MKSKDTRAKHCSDCNEKHVPSRCPTLYAYRTPEVPPDGEGRCCDNGSLNEKHDCQKSNAPDEPGNTCPGCLPKKKFKFKYEGEFWLPSFFNDIVVEDLLTRGLDKTLHYLGVRDYGLTYMGEVNEDKSAIYDESEGDDDVCDI